MAGSTVGAWAQIGADGEFVDNSTTASGAIKSSTKKTDKSNNTLDMQNFLTLLVAEMQNQDPLEPTKNSDYMAQLATFSQVEATTEVNERMLSQVASGLVGKAVVMRTNTNNDGFIGGVVDYWQKLDDTIYLGINGNLYDVNDLEQVMQDDFYKDWAGNQQAATDKTDEAGEGGNEGAADNTDQTDGAGNTQDVE